MMRNFLFVVVLLGLFTSIDVVAEVVTADTVEVTTAGLSFVPANVTIEVGDSVFFTGLLGGFHTVAEVDDALAISWNGGFHSPIAANDFTHTFNTPGTFFYICEPHVFSGMRGTVTVNAPIFGACCLESRGECTDDIDAADCSALGGRFGGVGSTCATIDPACEPPLSISLVLVAGGVAAAEENAGPGLTAPVYLTHAGDGSGRLFVVDQVGQIRIVKDGTLLPTPFLDLTSKIIEINAFFDERGVLGLAFHPDYANNGRFFVRYSAPRTGAPTDPCFYPGFVNGCHEEILAEYAVSGDPDVADPNSEIILFRVDEPEFNHDSGQVLFGPDGLLYWTLGDGGGGNDALHRNGLCDAGHCAGDDAVCGVSAQDCVDLSECISDEGFCTIPPDSTPPVLCNDGFECVAISAQEMPHGPIGNGQNKDTPLGSLLRIDVDSTPDKGLNYKIPPGNPFAGGGGTPEIYAYGLRNPYRFSFATVGASDVAIVGDVGQALFEEIDFIPISDTPGLLNYGWATREGFSCFDPFDVVTPPSTCATTGPSDETLLDPVADYPHPTPCIVDADCVSVDSVCNSEGFCNNIAGIAVIGGFVYNGSAYPALSGRYFFGDFGQSFVVPGGRLFYMDIAQDRAGKNGIHEVFIAPNGDPFGLALFGIGEDEDGELYVLAADNIGPSGNGFVFRVFPPQPGVTALSPRYLEITPPPSPEPYAIAVTPDCPSGATRYLATPFGGNNYAQLVDFPTALTSLEWGSSVRAFGTTIVPDTTYLVQTDFGAQLSPAASATTAIHGDVAGLANGVFLPPDGTFTFVIDVVAVVQSFAGAQIAPPIYQTDLAGSGVIGIECLPDQSISIIIDAIIALDAFQGGDGSIMNCPAPCP